MGLHAMYDSHRQQRKSEPAVCYAVDFVDELTLKPDRYTYEGSEAYAKSCAEHAAQQLIEDGVKGVIVRRL